MTRRYLLVLPLMLLVTAIVSLTVTRLLERDQAGLLQELEEERLTQLNEAALHFSDGLEDIRENLRFAAGMLLRGDDPRAHETEVRTLIEVVGEYKAVGVAELDRGTPWVVWDRRATAEVSSQLVREGLVEAVEEMLTDERVDGAFGVSKPLPSTGNSELRVFTTLARSQGRALAVAVLVEMTPLFAPFRLISSQPETKLLLLEPRGLPTKVTDEPVVRALQPATASAPPLLVAIEQLKRRGAGCEHLSRAEAEPVGLDTNLVLLCLTEMGVHDATPWTAGLLVSTRSIAKPFQRVVVRTLVGAVVVLGFLCSFALYVVIASRRAAALEESRRQTAALAQLHQHTQMILDHLPSGVAVMNEALQALSLNQALQSHSPAVPPCSLANLFPRAPVEVVALIEDLIGRARLSQRVESLFGRHLALFGSEARFNVHAVPLPPLMREAQTLLVLEDLTQVWSLEAQLVRAEKLATVGVLAAGIAHEIGTPMGVIRGRAEFIRGKLGEAHAQSAGLQTIIEQIDAVAGVIGQLLDFSRVDRAEAQPTSLAGVVLAVEELLHLEARRREIELRFDCPRSLPPLWANADQLRQVLVNLLLNGIAACSPGGTVRLSAKQRGGQVELQVVDDGCGVPHALQAQVFDPFFTTKKRGQGTGLGLTIVNQIIRNHDGRIRLESSEHAGTRVTIDWPIAREGAALDHVDA